MRCVSFHCPFYPSDTYRPQNGTLKAKVRLTCHCPLAFQLAPYCLPRKNGQDPQHGPPGPKRFALLPTTPSPPFLTHPSQGCSPMPEHAIAFQNSRHLPKIPQARKALCVPQLGSLAFHSIGRDHLSPSSISNLGAASLREFCVSFTHKSHCLLSVSLPTGLATS